MREREKTFLLDVRGDLLTAASSSASFCQQNVRRAQATEPKKKDKSYPIWRYIQNVVLADAGKGLRFHGGYLKEKVSVVFDINGKESGRERCDHTAFRENSPESLLEGSEKESFV